jgi:hypothetical protein
LDRSPDIAEGGQYVIEWDFANDAFTQLQPTSSNLTWETDRIARSADHKWAIFSAEQFYLYSSDADSFTTAPISSVNPPDGNFGVRGYAINADGTKMGVVSAGQAIFLDRSLRVLGTTPILFLYALAFTSDGGQLLLQYSFPVAIEALDANNYTAAGYSSGGIAPDDNLERTPWRSNGSGRTAFLGLSGATRAASDSFGRDGQTIFAITTSGLTVMSYLNPLTRCHLIPGQLRGNLPTRGPLLQSKSPPVAPRCVRTNRRRLR